MTGRVVAAVAVAALAIGCGKGDSKKIRRDKDAGPPVEAVDRGGGRARTGGDEREPNGSDAEATALPLGHYARGSLDAETDVDVYRVTVPGTGQLRVVLSGIDEVDLALELRDGNGAVVARSDRGPARTVEGFPGYGVTKGDYLVAVKEFVKPRPKKKTAGKPKGKKAAAIDAGVVAEGRAGPSQTYELTVELTERPPDLHEIEPDDDTGTAVEVLLADVVRGWIGWSGDVDLWKLALEGVAPQYGLDLEVTGVDGLTLAVEVLDAGGAKALAHKCAKGGPVVIKSVVPGLRDGAPPWHFVRIAADRSNPEATYELRFTTRLLELDEETEPNDDAARATPLRGDAVATSGTMRASYAAGDVDRYLLDLLTEPILLDVTVEPPAGVDVELEVAMFDGAALATASAGGAGAKERLSGVVVPAGKSAVITVKAKTAKGDTGEARPYRVIWSIVPASGDLPMPPEELPPEEPGPAGGEVDDGAGPVADPE